jgi:exosortase
MVWSLFMTEELHTAPTGLGGLMRDLAAHWNMLPEKGFFFGLAALWVALFHFYGNSTFGYIDTPSLFRWLYTVYTSAYSEESHGILIPWVVLALFWWKRTELAAVSKQVWPPALIGVAAGLLLHLIGYVGQQSRISTIGFFVGLYFLMGLAWGRAWLRACFFPYVLFLFSIPLGSLAEAITFPMRQLVTILSVGFSHVVLGVDVVRDGTRIFDPHGAFEYDVAPACSGIRSLISLLALTTIYGFVTFKTGWKRGVTVLAALPLALIGNTVRIVAVILAAEAFGAKAGMRVHDGAGFITFGIAIGCIMLLGYCLREDKQPVIEKERP